MTVSRIDGILLAAGESRRMGYPKPLLKIGARTFLAHAADAMLQAVERLVVVIGAHAQRVRAAVPSNPRIAVVDNAQWQRGQLSSIRAGLAELDPAAGAALVHLADHPTVRAETHRMLVDAFRRGRASIVVARFGGRRGHPVLFARAVFDELFRAPDDVGARAVVNADASRVEFVDTDDAGVTLDLDTREDLLRAGLPPPPPS
jgi:molybdenum cofactor cytidylyltransferase